MKRTGLFRLMFLGIMASAAVWLAPQVMALTSATFSFGGSYTVGGTGTKFATCSLDTTSVSLPKPSKSDTTAQAVLTCSNNTGVSMTFTINNSSLPPGTNKTPTFAWTTAGGVASTSMTIGSGSSDSRTVTFTRDNNDDDPPFTFTFNVSGTGTVLDYTRNGFSIGITN